VLPGGEKALVWGHWGAQLASPVPHTSHGETLATNGSPWPWVLAPAWLTTCPGVGHCQALGTSPDPASPSPPQDLASLTSRPVTAASTLAVS